jgi:hypothetical protein
MKVHRILVGVAAICAVIRRVPASELDRVA